VLGTPGHPLITHEGQIALVLVAGLGLAFLLHTIARRIAAKERSRADDEGDD